MLDREWLKVRERSPAFIPSYAMHMGSCPSPPLTEVAFISGEGKMQGLFI